MIIYFFPYELKMEFDRPSLKRPLKMLNAFKGINRDGDVVEVIGKTRESITHQLLHDIKNGLRDDIEFVYIESINKPLFLQCIIERKIKIFGDYFFFWQCKKNNIPLVIFYRDARWANRRFRTVVPKYLFYILKLAFYLEFKVFEFLFDVFFLPSIEMGRVLPFGKSKVHIHELPPAIDLEKYNFKQKDIQNKGKEFSLLYVGNINPASYDISPMIDVIKINSLVKLNICCRKNDWDQFNEYYNLKHIENINVFHFEGEKLAKLYRQSDIHIMMYAKDDYRLFAVPFKLFESLQYGVPIITNDGTKAASLVRELDVGWIVESQKEISDLIAQLNSDKSLVLEKKKNIHQILKDNTWKSRAEKVINICKKIKQLQSSRT